jgi:H+/gluconate symporter-like permease
MKLILTLLEIYTVGCAFILVWAFCSNLINNRGKFDVEMKMMIWCAILWPIMAVFPVFWIYEYLCEKGEHKRFALLLEKQHQNKEGINAGQPRT